MKKLKIQFQQNAKVVLIEEKSVRIDDLKLKVQGHIQRLELQKMPFELDLGMPQIFYDKEEEKAQKKSLTAAVKKIWVDDDATDPDDYDAYLDAATELETRKQVAKAKKEGKKLTFKP